MKIHAITDTHFGHKSLLKYGTRPEGYEEIMFKNLSKMSGDIFVHCGDVCLSDEAYWHKRLLDSLSGFKHKILVRGNHDHKSYSWCLNAGWNTVVDTFSIEMFGKRLLFTHGPVLARDLGGSYLPFDLNIHGHLHGDGVRRANGEDTDHRVEESTRAKYDLAYHKDIAPEIIGLSAISIESLCK